MVKITCDFCQESWSLTDMKDSAGMLIRSPNNLFMAVEGHEKKCKRREIGGL